EVDRVEPGGDAGGGVVGQVEPDDAALGGVGPAEHVGGEDEVLVPGDAAVAVEVDGGPAGERGLGPGGAVVGGALGGERAVEDRDLAVGAGGEVAGVEERLAVGGDVDGPDEGPGGGVLADHLRGGGAVEADEEVGGGDDPVLERERGELRGVDGGPAGVTR